MRLRSSRLFVVTASIIPLLAVGVALLFSRDISDYIKLRSYDPPAAISSLAEQTTMNGGTERLFYVHQPLLTDKQTFNDYCRSKNHHNEESIVLGCFISGKGIYLLDVTDERLYGVEQVTAAHELLHAAYERLSGKERARIDKLTAQTYKSLKDERIRGTVELYRQEDPAIVPNELHSILGTEVRDLPEELESYYARYFDDRLAIVVFSEKYEQAFIERRNQIRQYDEQLENLNEEINGLQSSLTEKNAALEVQRNRMNQRRASGDIVGYNQEVPNYNSKVNGYNAGVNELEALIKQYNEIVRQRNEIATEEAELVEALDSRAIVPDSR